MTPDSAAIPKILVILGSTREGRQGKKVFDWFQGHADSRQDFEFEYVDLLDWPLPMFGAQPHEAIQRWHQKVAAADGYVIVTPEYNHSYPAVLKNAIDWGGKAFRNKPVAFVGYTAGDAGAARAVEHLRLVAIEMQMAPIREGVHISHLRGALPPSLDEEAMRKRLDRFFAQLLWWSRALKSARDETPAGAFEL